MKNSSGQRTGESFGRSFVSHTCNQLLCDYYYYSAAGGDCSRRRCPAAVWHLAVECGVQAAIGGGTSVLVDSSRLHEQPSFGAAVAVP